MTLVRKEDSLCSSPSSFWGSQTLCTSPKFPMRMVPVRKPGDYSIPGRREAQHPPLRPDQGGSLGSKHSSNGATPAPGPGPSPATSESLPSPGTYAPRAAPENHMRVLGGLRVPPPARCSRWYLPPLSSGFCLAEPRRGWGAPRHPAWPPPKQGVPPFELRGRSCRCWERHWEHRKRKLFGRQSLTPRGVPVGGTGRDVTETQGHEDRVHRPRGIPLVGPLGARERVQGRMGPER